MLRGFIEAVDAKLGPSASTVIEEAAYTVGANFAQELLDRGIQTHEVPTIIELLFNQAGWGKSEFQVDSVTKTVTLSITNCVTSRDIQTTEPNCHFLKGYFKGVYEKLYGIKIQAAEISCTAKGDNACVFRLSPTPIVQP